MSGTSPEAILYDRDGSVLPVDNGVPYAADTPTLIMGGSDGTNARYIFVDSTGRQVMVGAGVAGTPAGGVISIQGVAGGTVVPTSVSGTVTISGTVTANIGTTGGLALDTSVNGILVAQNSTTSGQTGPLIQGAVTTAAPTYTTAKTSPLSLTTAGALRIDGSAVTQPVSGTVTANAGSGNFAVVQATAANLNATVIGTVTANIGTTNGLALDATLAKLTIAQGAALGANTQALIGGSVTTAAPTYTTGQISPISLTTAGAIRIDGSGVTQPISGTVTANAGTGNFTVVQATAANLRSQTASESTTATATGTVASLTGGAVTTAAPTYTTGQMNPLSLTTTGLLRIDGSGVTQPVSGTVTANIGTTNGLALDTTLTGGTQTTRITDGTNTATVKAASTAAVAADKALVVAISPNNSVTVTGTVTSNIGTTGGLALDTTLAKLTIAQSTALGANTLAMVGGSVTTASPTYTNGNINPLSLTTAGALRIDGSGVTQPVSGTVTANQGTANTLTNGWPVKVTDGTNTMPTADVAARAQFDKITDGTNTAAVKAASTAAVATDPALVVAISPNNTVAVTQSTSPWVINQTQINGSAVTVLAAGEQKVATEGLAANGAAASGNPVLIGGKDDANVARTVRTDPAGDVRVVASNVPSNATFGNPFGQAASPNQSGKFFSLEATTYTEQTTNAQRSIKSSSANDTNSAGTGARQVVITYLDQTGAGPFTETINLNGTAAVNTVSTTICFIEEIHVSSVGSTGSNQGTISLFTTTGGGGSAFASIAVGTVASNGTVGDNQTIWAHHYTPTGKTTTISATAFGTDGNRTGNGLLRSKNPTVTTSPELQITGTIVLDASSSTISRTYYVPVQVVGPARTTFYGVSSGTNTIFYGVFEYWDA